MVRQAEKAACAGKGVCPGCRRCSYVFTVARLALLQLVRGSIPWGGRLRYSEVHFVPVVVGRAEYLAYITMLRGFEWTAAQTVFAS